MPPIAKLHWIFLIARAVEYFLARLIRQLPNRRPDTETMRLSYCRNLAHVKVIDINPVVWPNCPFGNCQILIQY